jgi:DNA-binding NtrC family response regulator
VEKSESARNRNRVLHVDDDEDLLRFVRHSLRSDYDVVSLREPSRCIDELLITGCRIVVLDIDMPGVNGLDLLKEIKRVDGGVQVIMATGLVSMDTVLESMRLGAEACVFKPIASIEPLKNAIGCAVDKLERWKETVRELVDLKLESAAANSTGKASIALFQ